MPTALLAPATAAANSADFTVTTAGINVGLYTADGSSIGGDVVVAIKRKNPSGTYNDTGVVIKGGAGNQVIHGPGVYRAEKPVTSAAIGVQTD